MCDMKDDYKSEIIRIVSETESPAFIASVYSFIMGMLSFRKSREE